MDKITKDPIHGLAYHMICAAYNFLYNTSLRSMYNFLPPPPLLQFSVPIFEITIKEGWKSINPLTKKITVSASNFKRGNPRGPFVNALIDARGNVINLVEQSTLEDIFDFLKALVSLQKEFDPPAKLEPFLLEKKEKKVREKIEVIPGLWK
jgi:hypothetical protein